MFFLDKIVENAKRYSWLPAIHCDGVVITYRTLLVQALSYANYLVGLNKKGLPCIILDNKSVQYIQAMLAAFFAGLIYTPINIDAPLKRNKILLQSIGRSVCLVGDISLTQLKKYLPCLYHSQILFTNFELFKLVESFGLHRDIALIEESNNELLSINKTFENDSNDFAYLMHTSGSTGNPKGVPITFDSLDVYLNSVSQLFKFRKFQNFAQICDLAFDLSLHEILLCFMHAGTLYLYDENRFSCLANFIVLHKIEQVMLVPSIAALVLKQANYLNIKLKHLCHIFLCGEVLPIIIAKKFQTLCVNALIVNLYGPTEVTIACSYHIYHDKNDYTGLNSVPIGIAFPSVNFSLSHEGELLINGEQVFSGYWPIQGNNNQALLSYGTGDQIIQHDKYGYCFLSRLDDQWQVKGMRIERMDVESALRDVLQLSDLYVVPLYQNQLIESLVVCLCSDIDIHRFEQNLRVYLPAVVFPLRQYQLDKVPRLSNQKIDYRGLQKLVAEYF